MCMNCVSNSDALAANVVGAAILAVNGWERWSDRRRGITRLERAQRTWLRNKAFIESLDLDPLEVLGPAPGIDVATPDTERVPAIQRNRAAPRLDRILT